MEMTQCDAPASRSVLCATFFDGAMQMLILY